MKERLDKTIVLYMPSGVLNPDGKREGARCGRCMMFLPDLEACTIVHKADSKSTEVSGEHGVCGLYVGGKPMKSGGMHKPMPTVPRAVAGYIQDPGVPTHCGNCVYEQAHDTCAKVEGEIEEYGCCNNWEREPSENRYAAMSKG